MGSIELLNITKSVNSQQESSHYKKPGTVKLMQNLDLGHTKVIQIHQRETLSHQGVINAYSAQIYSLFLEYFKV